ncbi:MAG TPA: divalent metal cation transporter [Bacteroidia bacterium]|nr:divalent metal cation transporter [Bacteroidia bacterium]
MGKRKKVKRKKLSFWKQLGPGLITGASDDDPSGIATYSQAGAQFGTGFLWTALVTFPLMASLQEMCARIGLVTRRGLTGTLRLHYPRWVMWLMILFSFPAITINIGADLAGMGAVANMLVPEVSPAWFSLLFAFFITWAVIQLSYVRIGAILKYMCAVLLCYLIVPLLTKPDLLQLIRSTFIPEIVFSKAYLMALVGILGTTISPYLFFWQANMEVEEVIERKLVVDKRIIGAMRVDVDFGIAFSNLVFYFIILTAGTVLYNAGIHDVQTVEQAAQALRPLAGEMSYLLFSIGVIGTGFLAIPVLAGSLSYLMAEAFQMEEGFNKKFAEAKGFYIILIIAMVVSVLITGLGFSPVQSLIYAAVLYGLTAPVIIAIILHIANNKAIMGRFTNTRRSNVLGVITLFIMTLASGVLLYLMIW